MGLLRYDPKVPLNLNKGLISLWFRIPKASADIARASWAGFRYIKYPGLGGVVPLITFGPQQSDKFTNFATVDLSLPGQGDEFGFCFNSYDNPFGFCPDGTFSKFITPPSFIGVMFGGSETPQLDGVLAMNIQTNQYGTQSAGQYFASCGSHYSSELPVCGDVVIETQDISYVFGQASGRFNGYSRKKIHNPTDTWHHLLISWDVGNTESGSESATKITTDALLYVTLDGVNYSGEDELPAHIQGTNQMNAIGTVARGTFTQPIGTIPTRPISIPAPPLVKDENGTSKSVVQNVDMADLQLFAGLTMNTGDIVDLFVKTDKLGRRKPAGMLTAEKALKRVPDIRLRKRSNWIKGRNAGSGGDLTPMGTIKPFHPEPVLT